MKDEQLFQLCKNEDSRAQEMLYDRYAVSMFRLCMRYLKDDHYAEEAMIQGFYKVFTKIETFEWRGPASFVSWIKRIMVNESLMLLRKNKNRENDDDLQDVRLSNTDFAENGILAEEIYNMIAKLPLGYRTVFNMYVIEGYTHREIADKLGVQESTSKSQLSKARNQLKKWIHNLDML